jgi:hypothetical protein
MRQQDLSAVIPGRAEGASPESIFTGSGYGFRAPRFAHLNADLGMTEIGGPGMTGCKN